MSTIDQVLQSLNENGRETYVSYLREVVKDGPGIGGYGQYLGSIAPMIFATEAEKAEALRQMSEQAL
jgi:hypothetical protein